MVCQSPLALGHVANRSWTHIQCCVVNKRGNGRCGVRSICCTNVLWGVMRSAEWLLDEVTSSVQRRPFQAVSVCCTGKRFFGWRQIILDAKCRSGQKKKLEWGWMSFKFSQIESSLFGIVSSESIFMFSKLQFSPVWMLKGLKQEEYQFLTNKEKISTVNTCESTSNQPPTPTGQTHRKKNTTSKAYQSHGGRFVTGKIFILTDANINLDYRRTSSQQFEGGMHYNYV